jgi:hypothetical protein
MNNPEYNPENFGLEIIGSIEYSSGSYEFDTRIVWKDKEGKLYTARDSGCSCPIPFEGYNTLESLDTFDWDELKSEVAEELKSKYSHITPLEAKEFLKSVKDAMKPSKK